MIIITAIVIIIMSSSSSSLASSLSSPSCHDHQHRYSHNHHVVVIIIIITTGIIIAIIITNAKDDEAVVLRILLMSRLHDGYIPQPQAKYSQLFLSIRMHTCACFYTHFGLAASAGLIVMSSAVLFNPRFVKARLTALLPAKRSTQSYLFRVLHACTGMVGKLRVFEDF